MLLFLCWVRGADKQQHCARPTTGRDGRLLRRELNYNLLSYQVPAAIKRHGIDEAARERTRAHYFTILIIFKTNLGVERVAAGTSTSSNYPNCCCWRGGSFRLTGGL